MIASWKKILSKEFIIPNNDPAAFRAFTFFHPLDTKVIILGNKPNATGLAQANTEVTTSIKNIITYLKKSGLIKIPATYDKVLTDDYDENMNYITKNIIKPEIKSGSLVEWGRQGVLLLNISPAWKDIIYDIVDYLMKNTKCKLFIWGNELYEFAKPFVATYGISNDMHGRIYVGSTPDINNWYFDPFKYIDINWNPIPTIKIFTDGGCIGNGRYNATASYSVIYQNFIISTIAGRVRPNTYTYGKVIGYDANTTVPPTNNRGELLAICMALQMIYSNFKDANILIVSDSMYAINTATVWMYNQVKSGKVINIDLIRILHTLSEPFNIKYEHQPAHIKNPKTPNEIGNYEADKLAKSALSFENYSPIIDRVWNF